MSTFTYVPRKGRNAKTALKQKLDDSYFNWKNIGDMINGKGKEAAKNGETAEIEKELEKPGWQSLELEKTGREGRRPVLDEIKTLDETIEGYSLEQQPFQGQDEVWIPYDQAAEKALEAGKDVSTDLKETAQTLARDNGYELVDETGSEVTWAAMNNELEKNPSTVLIPEKFKELGEYLAESYWDSEFETCTYSGNVDEEREIAQTPEDVAGIYMYETGGTAKDFDIDYEQVGEAESRLGVFQNRFKDNEKTYRQEV